MYSSVSNTLLHPECNSVHSGDRSVSEVSTSSSLNHNSSDVGSNFQNSSSFNRQVSSSNPSRVAASDYYDQKQANCQLLGALTHQGANLGREGIASLSPGVFHQTSASMNPSDSNSHPFAGNQLLRYSESGVETNQGLSASEADAARQQDLYGGTSEADLYFQVAHFF